MDRRAQLSGTQFHAPDAAWRQRLLLSLQSGAGGRRHRRNLQARASGFVDRRPALGMRRYPRRARYAETREADGCEGQSQAREDGARHVVPPVRTARAGGGVERGLPHGRIGPKEHLTPMITPAGARDFILASTVLQAPPHVPEIQLHLAHEAHDLWHKTEEELEEAGLPPPFWAFAWAGGQGL